MNQSIPIFNKKYPCTASGKTFVIFVLNFPTEFEFEVNWGPEFSLHMVFLAYSRNSAYFSRPITLKLPKSPNSYYLKFTIKESTVLCPPLYRPSKPTIDFPEMPTPWGHLFVTWWYLMLKSTTELFQTDVEIYDLWLDSLQEVFRSFHKGSFIQDVIN